MLDSDSFLLRMLEQYVRQGVFKVGLYGSFDGSCAILRVIRPLYQLGRSLIGQYQLMPVLTQPLLEQCHLYIYYARKRVVREGVESNDIVDTIEELRREGLLQRLEQHLMCGLVV